MKRYDDWAGQLCEEPDGDYVEYADAMLMVKAERERIYKEVEAERDQHLRSSDVWNELDWVLSVIDDTDEQDDPPQHHPDCIMSRWDHFASYPCPLPHPSPTPPIAGDES